MNNFLEGVFQGIFLLVVTSIVIIGFYLLVKSFHTEPTKTYPLQNALSATCTIMGEDSNIGTGVLLDTGYVLTAGHCIDLDLSGDLTHQERNIEIAFNGGERIVGARAVYLGSNDFAILEPQEQISGGVKFNHVFSVGDEIHTIGAILGTEPMIFDGHIGHWQDGWARASCFVSHGNSGGGIFSEEGEVVGIVHAVATVPLWSSFEVPVITPDGTFSLYRSYALGGQEINGVCVFLTSLEIKTELSTKNLNVLIRQQRTDKLIEKLNEPKREVYKKLALTEAIFILVVFVAWRKL